MKLITNGQTYALVSFRPTADGCTLTAETELGGIGETLRIETDGGTLMREYTVSDWLRCEADGCRLTLSSTPAPEPVPVDLDALRAGRQEENKAALAAWLEAHPLTWTDGKQYGVTEEDQVELSLNLMQYQVAVQAGQQAALEWHARKEACRTFSEEEYAGLSLAIAAYVYPYRRYQEGVKAAIYTAATEEEIRAVGIDYAVVNAE